MFAFNIFNEEDNSEDQYIEDVDLFLKEHYNDRIIILTRTNYNNIQRPLFVFFHNFKLKATKFWTDILNEVACKYPNIQFAIADLDDVTLFHGDPAEMDFFGLDGSFEPYVFSIDADERQYKYQEPLTIDALALYCDKLDNNKLYRSDPIPTEQRSTDNVDVIVADNFRQLVEQNDKNVFVTIDTQYSFPFPHHLWDLPERLDREIIAFYKINSHTNYVPLEYAVEYPTSFLIPRNDRSKKLRYVHTFFDSDLRSFIKKAIPEIEENQQRHEEPESVGNTTTEDQKKLLGILEKLTEIVEKAIPCEENDDRGFSTYLSEILNKFEDADRDNIKVELITLASNRVNEVLKRRNRLLIKK